MLFTGVRPRQSMHAMGKVTEKSRIALQMGRTIVRVLLAFPRANGAGCDGLRLMNKRTDDTIQYGGYNDG